MENHPAFLCLHHFTALKMCFCTLATEWKWAGQPQEGGTDYGKAVGQRTHAESGSSPTLTPNSKPSFNSNTCKVAASFIFSFLMEKLQFEVICLFWFYFNRQLIWWPNILEKTTHPISAQWSGSALKHKLSRQQASKIGFDWSILYHPIFEIRPNHGANT